VIRLAKVRRCHLVSRSFDVIPMTDASNYQSRLSRNFWSRSACQRMFSSADFSKDR
jgi:hypothetical protein